MDNLDALTRHEAMVGGVVVSDAVRCVQCGICSYNCPLGINVRAHARMGKPIHESRCLSCGECVDRCPRSVLSFRHSSIFHPTQGT
jgi:ferredoxin